jgi:hypothetical protein
MCYNKTVAYSRPSGCAAVRDSKRGAWLYVKTFNPLLMTGEA